MWNGKKDRGIPIVEHSHIVKSIKFTNGMGQFKKPIKTEAILFYEVVPKNNPTYVPHAIDLHKRLVTYHLDLRT